jgi:hypothetical protein
MHEAARVMIETTSATLRATSPVSLQRVLFVLLTADALRAFDEALARVP